MKTLNMDCMEYMKTLPDKAYNLAVVDPPYGLGKRLSQGAGKLKDRKLKLLDSSWDIKPTKEYFEELFRISENQVIFGGNYFELPATRGIIAWDKQQPWENFSQWEYIWTSYDKPAAMYRQNNAVGNPGKWHPTQKPVQIYKWLFSRYAKPGDKVIDTHGGSGTILHASMDFDIEITWIEKDKGIYNKAMEQLKEYQSQGKLF